MLRTGLGCGLGMEMAVTVILLSIRHLLSKGKGGGTGGGDVSGGAPDFREPLKKDPAPTLSSNQISLAGSAEGVNASPHFTEGKTEAQKRV